MKQSESVLASRRETTILPSQKTLHTLSRWKAFVVSLPELPCMHNSGLVAIALTVPSVEVTVPTHRLGSNVVLSPTALARFPKAADALIYLAISIH